jgi:hypothetical protein
LTGTVTSLPDASVTVWVCSAAGSITGTASNSDKNIIVAYFFICLILSFRMPTASPAPVRQVRHRENKTAMNVFPDLTGIYLHGCIQITLKLSNQNRRSVGVIKGLTGGWFAGVSYSGFFTNTNAKMSLSRPKYTTPSSIEGFTRVGPYLFEAFLPYRD